MEETSDILERLASSMIENNIEPEELIREIVQVRKLPLTRRAALGLGLGAAAIGMGAGTVLAGDVSSGSVASAEGQFATISGTSGSTVIDLSSNIPDFQNINRMVLPLYAGTNPSTVVGDFYYDTTSD